MQIMEAETHVASWEGRQEGGNEEKRVGRRDGREESGSGRAEAGGDERRGERCQEGDEEREEAGRRLHSVCASTAAQLAGRERRCALEDWRNGGRMRVILSGAGK